MNRCRRPILGISNSTMQQNSSLSPTSPRSPELEPSALLLQLMRPQFGRPARRRRFRLDRWTPAVIFLLALAIATTLWNQAVGTERRQQSNVLGTLSEISHYAVFLLDRWQRTELNEARALAQLLDAALETSPGVEPNAARVRELLATVRFSGRPARTWLVQLRASGRWTMLGTTEQPGFDTDSVLHAALDSGAALAGPLLRDSSVMFLAAARMSGGRLLLIEQDAGPEFLVALPDFGSTPEIAGHLILARGDSVLAIRSRGDSAVRPAIRRLPRGAVPEYWIAALGDSAVQGVFRGRNGAPFVVGSARWAANGWVLVTADVRARAMQNALLASRSLRMLAGAIMALAMIGILAHRRQRRARALEADAEAAATLEAMFSSTADAVITIDAAGAIRSLNPAVEILWALPGSALIGHSIYEQLAGASRAELENRLLAWPSDASPARLQISRADGTEIQVEATIGRIHPPPHVEFTVFLRDISARERREQELRQTQRLETVGRLAGGIAHEFNNIMMVVLGFADLLRESPRLDATLAPDVEEIRAAGARAALLTKQMLAFGRRSMLRRAPTDLNLVVMRTAGMLRGVIGEDLTIDLELEPRDLIADVDENAIMQVLTNLVLNAKDAEPRDRRIVIVTRGDPRGEAIIEVRDSGIGMDEETLSHAFEPFFTTKDVGQGTGLGLAMSYGLVASHGGDLRAESRVGYGTTMRIALPLSAERRVDAARGAPVAAPVVGVPGLTVLLAEDEATVRRIVERQLRRAGHLVITASDGADALAKAAACAGEIDVLLTDVVMPGISGRELAMRLRPLRPSMRVIYMSGYTDADLARRELATSDADFLVKPFAFESLQRILAAETRDRADVQARTRAVGSAA